jgi:hypothetical protein
MSRDDSLLYSAQTSASRKIQAVKKERTEAKQELRAILSPDAELVRDEITRMRGEIKDMLRSLVNPSTPLEDVKTLILGLNIADQKIVEFHNRLNLIMKVPKESDER